MSDTDSIIRALSKPFDAHVIQIKPGSAKKPATKFVSHGSVTKRLNEVCPGWSSRLISEQVYTDGTGQPHCAGVLLELTIDGVSRVEAGGPANRGDYPTEAKNALSDALKRAAMRFGVAIDLWEEMDEGDEDARPANGAAPPARPQPARSAPSAPQPANPAPAGFARAQATVARVLGPASAPPAAGVTRPVDWNQVWPEARAQGINNSEKLIAFLGKRPDELGTAAILAKLRDEPVPVPASHAG